MIIISVREYVFVGCMKRNMLKGIQVGWSFSIERKWSSQGEKGRKDRNDNNFL